MFSKHDVQSLLNQTDDFAYKTTYKKTGPGYADFWLMLFEREDIWLHTDPQKSLSNVKEIIWCTPYEAALPSERVLVSLMSSLIENFNIYFWPGPKKSLREIRPLSSPDEFWQQVQGTIPASKEAVLDSLGYQGLSVDNYFIMDYSAYHNILNKLAKLFVTDTEKYSAVGCTEMEFLLDANAFNLTQFNLDRLNNLLPHLPVQEIKAVKVLPIRVNDIILLRRSFPKLETVIVIEPTLAWCDQYLSFLNDLSVEIRGLHDKQYHDTFIIRQNIRLNTLALKNLAHTGNVEAENGAQIKALEIEEASHYKVDIGNLSQCLTSLCLSNAFSIDLRISPNNIIESLTLQNADLDASNLNISCFPHLKKLNFENSCANFLRLNSALTKRILAWFCIEVGGIPPRLSEFKYSEKYRGSAYHCEHYNINRLDLTRSPLTQVTFTPTKPSFIHLPSQCVFVEKPNFLSLRDYGRRIPPSRFDNRGFQSDLRSAQRLYVYNYHAPAYNYYVHIKNYDYSGHYSSLESSDIEWVLYDGQERDQLYDLDAPHLKYLKLRTITGFKTFSLSNYPALIEADLHVSQHSALNFNLEKNVHLVKLKIDASTANIGLIGLKNCKNLRLLIIKSQNADALKLSLADMPAECMCIFKQTGEAARPMPAGVDCDPNCGCFSCLTCDASRESSNDLKYEPVDDTDIASPCTCFTCVNLPEASAHQRPDWMPSGKTLVYGTGGLALLIAAGVGFWLLITHLLKQKNAAPAPTVTPTIPAPPGSAIPTKFDFTKFLPILYVASAAVILGVCLYAIIKNKKKVADALKQDPRDYDPSLFGAIALDSITYSNISDRLHPVGYKFNFFTNGKFNLSHARIHIQNTITLKNDRMFFHCVLKNSVPLPAIQKDLAEEREAINKFLEAILKNENKTEGLGITEVILSKNRIHPYPLATACPVQQPTDITSLYVSEPGLVNFIWDNSTQQVYFKINPDRIAEAHGKNIIIYFGFKEHKFFNKDVSEPDQVFPSLLIEDPATLLPKELLDALPTELEKIPEMFFLLDPAEAISARAAKLVQYIKGFNNTNELNPAPYDPIQRLVEIIKQQFGICRHRSEVVMVLLRYLGIPVNCHSNRVHMYVAIPYINSSQQIQYQRDDLTLPDVIPIQDISAEVVRLLTLILQLMNAVEDNKIAEKYDAKQLLAYQYYHQQFKKLVAPEELTEFASLLDPVKRSLAPLIELTPEQDVYTVHAQILKHLEANNFSTKHHLFIQSANDFANFYAPNMVKGEIIKSPVRPLKDMFTKPNYLSVLVVNWSGIADDLATFQCLIDAEPMFSLGNETLKISKTKTLIIGLIDHRTSIGKAFSSRCKRWYVGKKFFADPAIIKIVPVDRAPAIAPLEKNLHGLLHWREMLLGEFLIRGTQVMIGKSILVEAVEARRNIILYNPPNDAGFELFVHQVNVERKFFYNGQWLIIPDDVQINLEKRLDNIKPNNVTIQTSDTGKRKIHLGISTIHEMMKEFIVKNHGKGKTRRSGRLKKYNSDQECFYITDNISKNHWQYLMEFIQTNFADKSITFELAPGVMIEGVEVAPSAVQSAKLTNFIFSNDPDYFSACLIEEWDLNNIDPNKKIIPMSINEETTFNDLIAKTFQDKTTKQFKFEPQVLAKALQEGHTVVINGEMNYSLYLQLLSLFSDTPYLYMNGQRVILPGKLIAVLPSYRKGEYPGVYTEKNYTLEDYKNMFAPLHPANAAWLDKLATLFAYAAKLPHRGPGRPATPPQLNFYRLKKCLEILNNPAPLHSHNPLKGLLNYNYPRHSDDEAYLNVIAKYLFDDHVGLNQVKFSELKSKYHLNDAQSLKHCIWQVLNCLNGSEIKKILGSELKKHITSTGFPTLDAHVLEATWAILQDPTIKIQPQSRLKREEKHRSLLDHAIKQGNPVLFIKGPPGVGKTHTARYLLGKIYENEEQLLAWLEAEDKGENIFFLWDEGNKERPGKLDFIIKGLLSKDRIVVHNNKIYRLSRHHRFIVTGNPEDFPDRYYHPALDYAETIYFGKPDESFLAKRAKSILKAGLHEYADLLIYAYSIVNKFNPFLVTSIRTIENISRRLNITATMYADIKQAIFAACTGEFSGSIRNREDRSAFEASLQNKIGYQPNKNAASELIHISENISVTQDKAYMIYAIQQVFIMRLHALFDLAKKTANPIKTELALFTKSEPDVYLKQAIILEGDPGVGKSTLHRAMIGWYKNILDSMRNNLIKKLAGPMSSKESNDAKIELEVIEKELAKKIYEMSGGKTTALSILTEALHAGAFVIEDESNVNPESEGVLTQYLSGVDENKKPISSPGFMILGSQNATTEQNRLPASKAVRDRANFLYYDDNERREYGQFLTAAGMPHVEVALDAFYAVKDEFPATNTRTFHTALVEIRKDKKFMLEFCNANSFNLWRAPNEQAEGDNKPLLQVQRLG